MQGLDVKVKVFLALLGKSAKQINLFYWYHNLKINNLKIKELLNYAHNF